MQQKELAVLLDISPAMVSRLAKRGMPTDSLERAERWRRRHLEPGRVKGRRFEPGRIAEPTPVKPASPPQPVPQLSDADVEAVADLVNGALTRGDDDLAAARLLQLRELLPDTAPGASPRLPVRVWLSLLSYMLHAEAAIRNAPDMAELLTPEEVGTRFFPPGNAWPGHVVVFEACDFERYSVNGWPDDDPE